MTTSDWVLAAYIFLLVPAMLIGFGFARRHLFEPHHKLMMTTITIVNWILIIFVMLVTYTRDVAPNVPQHLNFSAVFVPTLHLLTGLVAQLLATYLVFRMWFEKRLPEWIKVKNIKIYMRTTLALWLLTALLGLGVWATFYHNFLISPQAAAQAGSSQAGQTVTVSMLDDSFSPAELTITPGTTVHFVNAGLHKHTVTADDDSFDSGQLASGKTFDQTFTKVGDVPLYCANHGDKGGVGMSMVIHVVNAGATPASTSAASVAATPAATHAATSPAKPASTAPATPASTSAATQSGTSQAAQTGQIVTVSLIDDSFSPAELTITPGTTVHFVNNGKHKHTVTADDDSFDSGQLASGKTFDQTFTKVGDVPLYCANHGDKGGVGMSMVIHVINAGAAPAATSGAPVPATSAATAVIAHPASTSAATSISPTASTSAATIATLNPTAVAALNPLVVGATDTPKMVAYLFGVKSQAAVIATQVTTLQSALQQGHIEDAQVAAEGIINAINGGVGVDLNKDGVITQPGDGYGLQQYIFSVNEAANTAAAVAGIPDETHQRLVAMQTVGRSALTDMQALTTQAKAVIAATALTAAQAALPALSTAAAALNNDATTLIRDGAAFLVPGNTLAGS